MSHCGLRIDVFVQHVAPQRLRHFNVCEVAPVYDVLSTVPYIPADAMALSLGRERSFKALTSPRWEVFAHRARLPVPAVLKTVVETVTLVNEHWWHLPERGGVPAKALERIDEHVKLMMPILNTCAGK